MVSPEEEKEGNGGKDLEKRNVLSLEWKTEGVMDDESGEPMEPMGEVPLIAPVSQNWRDYSSWLSEKVHALPRPPNK